MAYPPEVPALTRAEWEAFLKKLKAFTLTPEQEEFWREGRKMFRAKK